MSIEQDIYTRLSGNAPLAALVGTRIYPGGARPQGSALPAVAHQRISTPMVSGFSRGVIARSPRFQFTCWATTPDGCAALMRAVGTALLAMTGSTVTINSVTLDSERGPYLVPDIELYRGEVDALILHQGV